jgi:hypothetical protein
MQQSSKQAAPQPVCKLGLCMATVGVRKRKNKLGGGGRPPVPEWPTLSNPNSSIEALADALRYKLYWLLSRVGGLGAG